MKSRMTYYTIRKFGVVWVVKKSSDLQSWSTISRNGEPVLYPSYGKAYDYVRSLENRSLNVKFYVNP